MLRRCSCNFDRCFNVGIAAGLVTEASEADPSSGMAAICRRWSAEAALPTSAKARICSDEVWGESLFMQAGRPHLVSMFIPTKLTCRWQRGKSIWDWDHGNDPCSGTAVPGC